MRSRRPRLSKPLRTAAGGLTKPWMALALILAATALTGDRSTAQERPRQGARQSQAVSDERGALAAVGAPGKSAAPVSAVPPQFPGDAKQPLVRKLRMRVTAYCPCGKCCDGYADVPMSRRMIGGGSIRLQPLVRDNVGFAAAPPSLPIGTRLIIPGYHGGRPVKVLDRGSDIHGQHLDVFMPTHQQALAWGSRMLTITVCP